MPIDLYYHIISPPCRSVLVAAKILGIEFNLKVVDMSKNEHMAPEFLKLNPEHTLPTIVDDGFILAESRAIITYLANKYRKGTPLYPEDPQARALVDQRLYFDVSVLYKRFGDYAFPYAFEGAPRDEAKLKKVYDALEFLEAFLTRNKFVAGSHITLADLSIMVTVSSLSSVDIDLSKYPKIKAWYETVKSTTPEFDEVNEQGRAELEGLIKTMIKDRK